MPRGKGIQRTKEQILSDHELISSLLVLGQPPAIILERLNAKRPYRLALRTVQKDIADIRESWARASQHNIAQHVERELRLLDRIGVEAIEAWERSKPRVASDGKGRSSIQGNRHGSSEYLSIVIKCSEQRCKILGIGKERREISGPKGVPFSIGLPESEPRRLEVVLLDESRSKLGS